MTLILPNPISSYSIIEKDTIKKMLFEILPLIVYQMAGSGLTELPTELIALALRYLDPDSLLNVVKAYKRCKDVCMGDPILRRRVKTSLEEKKKLEMERMMNPALGVTVTRTGSRKMFGKNVTKKVEVHVFQEIACLEDLADFVDCTKKKSRKNVMPKVSKKCNYRL